MAQRKKLVKVCDRELKEKPASQTILFTYLDTQYELDLCDTHAQQFDREMASWTRVAREVEQAPKVFDDSGERWRDLLQREQEHRRAYGDVPIAATLLRHGEDVDDVVTDEPPVFSEWTLTDHAIERQLERGFTHEEVLSAAVAPERVFLDADKGRRRHLRDRVCAVVEVDKKAIITVMFANREDYLTHLEEKEKSVVRAS